MATYPPTEPSVYGGTAAAWRDSTILTHTRDTYNESVQPYLRHAAFNSTPALKVLAIRAFGGKGAIGQEAYGNLKGVRPGGIFMNRGGYQESFTLFTTTMTGTIVGALGNINPQFLSPGTSGAFSWLRLAHTIAVVEEQLKDNVGAAKIIDILATQIEIAKNSAIKDINNIWCGSSSAPSGSPAGLNNAVSVTQTSAISSCGNTAANTWWQNRIVACTSTGGGDSLDRPILLLRAMEQLNLRCSAYAESRADAVVWLVTTGAYQYYARAAYADKTAMSGLRNEDYYDASLEHLLYNGRPVVFDNNVQVPTGGTASTDAMYRLDLNAIGLSFKENEYFDLQPWDYPRVQDKQRYVQSLILSRLTLAEFARRIQGVVYNIPLNPDSAAA